MKQKAVEAEPVMTSAEVAAFFRVDSKTVTRWAEAGLLSSFRTLGGHRRFKESEVINAMREATDGRTDQ